MNIAPTIPLADAWMHGSWGWGWMSLMIVMMLLFWGAIIAIVWLIRAAASGRPMSERPTSGETPAQSLDRRFAQGEIEEEDYRARREVLAGRGERIGRT
jgi:putative membrane protein